MMDKLEQITGGDKELAQQYIQNYIKTMAANIAAIKEAVSVDNYEEVLSIVQRAKPLFTTMGFDSIYRMANHVEMGVKKRYSLQNTKENTLSLIDDIQDSIDQLKRL